MIESGISAFSAITFRDNLYDFESAIKIQNTTLKFLKVFSNRGLRLDEYHTSLNGVVYNGCL